jgi:hypothetical protein
MLHGAQVASEGANTLQTAHRGDRLELRPCLIPRADNSCRACMGVGEVLRGHAAGRSGTNLTERIGLNQGRHFSGGRSEKRNHKARAAARNRIELHAYVTADWIGRRHVVQQGVVRKLDSPARVQDQLAFALLAQRLFHDFKGDRHGQQGSDVRFREQ